MVWLAVDSMRGARVLKWLRRGDVTGTPAIGGLWGEVVDRARRALRLREQEAVDSGRRLQDFLAAIQASPNGVVLLDPQGRIEWSNQTAAEQFGFDLQRDMMQQIANLVRDPAFTAYYNSGGYGHEIVIQGPRSSPSRPVKLSVHLHPYGEGRKLLLSRDVTAVEQAEIMRRDFVANVSHEIRTPLTVLMGFVETLQNLPLDEKDRARYLALMAQQANRMQTLVSDLLTLSRLEGSPLPGASEWTPVALLMAHCEQEGQALSAALGKEHTLHFEPAPALEIAGAPSELQSALSNLVSNAVRYTPARRNHPRAVARADRRPQRVFGARHRHRHCARAHLQADGALLSRRSQPFAGDRGHRPGPCHREARGAEARRRVEDPEHARRGIDLRDPVPRQPPACRQPRYDRTARHRIAGRIRPSSASAIVPPAQKAAGEFCACQGPRSL